MNYEYLKPFFEGGPLSFEQLTEKLDAADGVKLANLKDGGYVGKDKFATTRSGRPRPSRCSRRPTRR